MGESGFGMIAGRYQLRDQLGVGGMGRVWLAYDQMLGREVAIKEVAPRHEVSDEESDNLCRMILREARATARINHPHVVQIYDVIQSERWPWIVMEYVPSLSLHKVIQHEGPLPPGEVAVIGIALLGALGAAHAAGILHRDVKPDNVLIGEDGRVVLTDFGLARFDADPRLTQTNRMGTPQYVAPERARQGISSREADLWSLGATLYAAVEGRSPYARATMLQTLTALATQAPDPMRRAGPLEQPIMGLLRRDPAERISPAKLEQALQGIIAGDAVQRPRGKASRHRRPGSRKARMKAKGAQPGTSNGAQPFTRNGAQPFTRNGAQDGTGQGTPHGTPHSTGHGTRPWTPGGTGQGTRHGTPGGTGQGTRHGTPGGTGQGRRDGRGPGTLMRRLVLAAGVPLVALTVAAAVNGEPAESPVTQHGRPVGVMSCDGPHGTVEAAAKPLRPGESGPGEAMLPDGWVWYHDPDGYSVGVPGHWLHWETEGAACFRDPSGSRMLAVGTGPLDAPGYQSLRDKEINLAEPVLEREFAYDGEQRRRRALALLMPQRTLLWACDEFDFQPSRSLYDVIRGSFRQV